MCSVCRNSAKTVTENRQLCKLFLSFSRHKLTLVRHFLTSPHHIIQYVTRSLLLILLIYFELSTPAERAIQLSKQGGGG
jgi:hypothetical protein